jgi:hypothetical protein
MLQRITGCFSCGEHGFVFVLPGLFVVLRFYGSSWAISVFSGDEGGFFGRFFGLLKAVRRF